MFARPRLHSSGARVLGAVKRGCAVAACAICARWNKVEFFTKLTFARQVTSSAVRADDLGTAVVKYMAEGHTTAKLGSALAGMPVLNFDRHSEEVC